MGVISSVWEILLLLKTAKFPFPTMDYSPWSSKNLVQQNWLKIFRQAEVNVKCMQTNFGGRDLSGFGDFATFYLPSKRSNFPFRPRTIVHGDQKIESAQKIHASRG